MTFDQLKSLYAGKRVFLTGHTGFKGAWMLPLLKHLGATTLGYALAPETTPSMFDLLKGEQLCESVFADLRDRATLTKTLVRFKPDVVMHFAAQSLVRRSYRDPIDTFESNILGTANVLEAVRQYDGRCAIVAITTDKVYAESGKAGYAYVEADKLGGWDPYSTSKAACEIVAEGYRLSFFHPRDHAKHGKALATARAGNVIGGGDWCEDRLIPDVVRAMSRGESVRLRNPRSVRPWQHVLEPLTGYLTLGAKLMAEPTTFAEGFNFGPDENDVLEVETVVQLALRAWGSGRYHVDVDSNAPHESAYLKINSTKAKQRLGWTPRWDARMAITKTVEWYRHAMSDPLAYTNEQIRGYFDRS
ncbi:MAG: CDP-glucose 4,6-dehydratase [Tepidisphaeraceae bacterium]